MRLQGKRQEQLTGEAFWRFSLALYARPGVAAALLLLQDRDGSDVNLILFALWCGAVHGRRLDKIERRAAAAAIAPVGPAVVAPLRNLRRRLRPAGDPLLQDLRRRIGVLELAGERSVQYRLAAAAASGVSGAPLRPASAAERLDAASRNLANVLGIAAESPEATTLRAALAALVRHR